MLMATQAASNGDRRHLAGAVEERSSDLGEHLLVQELTHRFNNELTSMTGFVSLMAARSANEEVKLALAGVLQRINDIALIQRALRAPAEGGPIDGVIYLSELCRSISSAKLQYRNIQLSFLECPVKLGAVDCWRLGMIVSELINNAARHAFDEGGGMIRISMANRGSWLECSVADNGRGIQNSSEGRGMKIVRLLAELLNGRVEYRGGATGTTALLSFPLSDVEQAAGASGAIDSKQRTTRISGREAGT